MMTTCEHCGKETTVKGSSDKETPEVELSVEGNAASVRSLLTKLVEKAEGGD